MILKCYQCVAKHKLQRPKIAITDREQKPSRFAFRMSFLAQLIMRRAFLANCLCFPANACLPRSENYSIWGKKLWKMVGEWERRRSKDSRCANAKQSIIIHHLQKRRFAREKNYAFKRLRQNTNNYHHTSLFAGVSTLENDLLDQEALFTTDFDGGHAWATQQNARFAAFLELFSGFRTTRLKSCWTSCNLLLLLLQERFILLRRLLAFLQELLTDLGNGVLVELNKVLFLLGLVAFVLALDIVLRVASLRPAPSVVQRLRWLNFVRKARHDGFQLTANFWHTGRSGELKKPFLQRSLSIN